MRLIDADALKEYIAGMTDVFDDSDIDEQPTIDPVKRGKWELKRFLAPAGYPIPYLKCSVCDRGTVVIYDTPYEYCPHCGAKMEDEVNECY